jgi:hypothetical protein
VHSTEFIPVTSHLYPSFIRSFLVFPPAKLSEAAKNWDVTIITAKPTTTRFSITKPSHLMGNLTHYLRQTRFGELLSSAILGLRHQHDGC